MNNTKQYKKKLERRSRKHVPRKWTNITPYGIEQGADDRSQFKLIITFLMKLDEWRIQTFNFQDAIKLSLYPIDIDHVERDMLMEKAAYCRYGPGIRRPWVKFVTKVWTGS